MKTPDPAKLGIEIILVGFVLLVLTMTMVTNIHATTFRPPPALVHDSIDYNSLISAYKRAYIGAGFTFEKSTTDTIEGRGVITRLTFNFKSHANHPGELGIVVIELVSRLHQGACAPCAMYLKRLSPGDRAKHTPDEWEELKRKITAAYLAALAQIAQELT